MNTHHYMTYWACLAGLITTGVAQASVINFEAVPGPEFTGQSTYLANGAPRDLIVNTDAGPVSIVGGTVFSQETFLPADRTNLYGTAFFGTGTTGTPAHGYLPTITLDFSHTNSGALDSFYLDVYNGQVFNVTYTVADNAGHSKSFALVPNMSSGTSQIGFSPVGNVVTITSDAGSAWDFSVDNIHFNEGLPTSIPTVVQAPPSVSAPVDLPPVLVSVDTPPPQPTEIELAQRENEGLDEQKQRRNRGNGHGNQGRDFRLVAQGFDDAPAPVPLPASLPLLVAAVGGLGALRRRPR